MAGKAGSSGGKRSNAGRRKGNVKDEIAVQAPQILAPVRNAVEDEQFFTEILDRIGDADIGHGPRKKIESAVDYALAKLYCGDKQIEAMMFKMIVEHKYGRPAQGVFVGDTREVTRRASYGNLPHTISAPQPGGDRKPN